MDSQPLLNRVAIVTGAGRGIGRGIVHRFAAEGASVVIADVDADLGTEAAGSIAAETGRRVVSMPCDVADRAAVDALVDGVVKEFGRLDIMVPNAGICPFLPCMETDNATFDRVIDINLAGAFNCGQAAAKKMIELGNGGRLIFITSLATIRPDRNQVDYAASKGGVKMMMSVFAQNLGRYWITANAIAPGVIQTPIATYWDDPEHQAEFAGGNPIPRVGQPSDVAAAALFLASDDAQYITGTTIRVDGGREPIG
jgi:2-hydroxycyclohexanecarboxyl-CoA dehydrogenase